ncbi:MAG: gamma-glutamyl-gamma-aminobutyrate hydrolase family protein [Acidobacteria bacterium ACB1]|nr:Gamma-glutamyl-gamma-aminobutyrate hydrolase PuuD [Pyrinomonadaceae bacterium]MCE7962810.1 gamma-glutamyl-gamma-aminobutyrate hydrolase family protein [Acidobacteria bacterium ACB1]
MTVRPRVGITMRLELETDRFYLGRDYSEAVEAMGCTPVHIALIPNEDYISAVAADLDGILLPGSDSDVDPNLFGEAPHPKLGRVVPEKDVVDRLVLDAAEARNLPVLAICFGMQALNVHRGGSLIQDIGSEVKEPIKHEQGIPRGRNSHSIRVEKGLLSGFLPEKTLECRVNSHHHQALRNIGANLKATAWAPDGIVECIEDTRPERHVLGVQWHPELSWKSDDLSAAIFRWFADRCRETQRAKASSAHQA